MDGSQVDCRLLPRLARRRGEQEGMESRVAPSILTPIGKETAARSSIRRRRRSNSSERAAGRFVLLRGARVIHGIPRCGRRRCLVDYCCCRAVFTSAP